MKNSLRISGGNLRGKKIPFEFKDSLRPTSSKLKEILFNWVQFEIHAPGLLRFFAVTPNMMIPIIFLTQFWIFAGLIISTKHVLGLKSNIKSFGIVFLSFLIIAFLSISFVMSRMNMLPVNQIS